MAIDRTGISSLNAGASDITYTGNEGPRSPQQQQMMLAQLKQEYEQYRMEQMEIDPAKVLSFQEWYQATYEASRQGVSYGGSANPTYTQSRKQRINAAGGGIMGSNAGSMLVAPTADGSRPGYAWWNPMDWIPNEIKDPIAKVIPNELKNPAVAAIAANYLPSLIPGGDATLLQKGKRYIDQLGNVDQINKSIMPLNYAPQNPSFDEQYEDIEDIIAGQPGKLGTGPITIKKPAPRLTDITPEGTGTTGEGWLYNLGQGAKDLAEGLGGTIGAGVGALGSGIGTLGGLIGQGIGDVGGIAKKIGQTILPGGDPGYVPGGLYKTAAQNIFGTPASAYGNEVEAMKKIGIGGSDGVYTNTNTNKKDTDQDLGFWREALATILPGGDPGFFPKTVANPKGGLYNKILGGLGPKDPYQDPETGKWIYPVNIAGPIAGGVAAGLAQSQMPKAQLPTDTSGINIADIRSRALTGSDPDLHFLPPAEATTAYAQGGRTGYRGGGADYMPTDPGPMGNPAVVEDIEDMREFRIANPDIEDVTDYSGYYERLRRKKLREMMGRRPRTPKAPWPGGRELLSEDIGDWEWGSPDLTEAEKKDANLLLKKLGFAQGGRTGYATGDRVQKNMITAFSNYKNKGGKSNFNKWFSDVWLPESQGIAALPIDEGDPYTPTPDWYPKEPWDSRPEREIVAQGGRIGAQEGGLMDLGGMEKDYRQEGGFVPLGGEEKADDVPARLSKNEFVFTADAVRSAGGGDIDAGAEVMENVLNHLEQGGQVSEESQGLEGARNMFATAKRLEGVM